MLASWVEPVFLSSIVVGSDPRTDGPGPLVAALRRAVPERAGKCWGSVDQATLSGQHSATESPELDIFVTSVVFHRCKTQVRSLGDS